MRQSRVGSFQYTARNTEFHCIAVATWITSRTAVISYCLRSTLACSGRKRARRSCMATRSIWNGLAACSKAAIRTFKFHPVCVRRDNPPTVIRCTPVRPSGQSAPRQKQCCSYCMKDYWGNWEGRTGEQMNGEEDNTWPSSQQWAVQSSLEGLCIRTMTATHSQEHSPIASEDWNEFTSSRNWLRAGDVIKATGVSKRSSKTKSQTN